MKITITGLRVYLLFGAAIFYIGFAWFLTERSTTENIALFTLIITMIYSSFVPLKYYRINIIFYSLGLIMMFFNLFLENLSLDLESILFYLGIIFSFCYFIYLSKNSE